MKNKKKQPGKIFLSTLSLRRATSEVDSCSICSFISIHALLAESDEKRSSKTHDRHISIHALLAESDSSGTDSCLICSSISIHALLAESDSSPRATMRTWKISIHALLAESDREPTALRTPHQRFLSTLSLRRATEHLLAN